MKKSIVLFIIITAFDINTNGQKRWAFGLSGSIDKLVSHHLLINKVDQYTLYFGASLNLIVQRDINKNWFLRSGINYFSYTYQYDHYSELTYYNASNVAIFNIIENKYYATKGFIEIPISLGYQVPLSNSAFKFYITLGGSLIRQCFENSTLTFDNSSVGASNTYILYQNRFSLGYNGIELNLMGTMGLSYSISPDFIIFSGGSYRQLINSDTFGSVGFQLGALYYWGKPEKQ